MKYIIITGAARGLGQAFATLLSSEDTKLILVDKRDMSKTVAKCKGEVKTFEFDLAKMCHIEELIDNLYKEIELENAEAVHLINNAAEVVPIGFVGKYSSIELKKEFAVDLGAYIQMANEFIKRVQDLDIDKRMINISSGAGSRPVAGLAVYCACKAGVDMFVKSVAKEQEKKEFPVKVVSVTPGVIDTEMQVDLRSAAKEDLPSAGQFKLMHKTGVLQSPEYVAKKIIKLFDKEKFPQGKVVSYIKL